MSDFTLIHELTLVRELMALIERYNSDHSITARPDAIRDTLLTVAGLLHREAARLENAPSDPKRLEDDFAEKARERLSDLPRISQAMSPLQ